MKNAGVAAIQWTKGKTLESALQLGGLGTFVTKALRFRIIRCQWCAALATLTPVWQGVLSASDLSVDHISIFVARLSKCATHADRHECGKALSGNPGIKCIRGLCGPHIYKH